MHHMHQGIEVLLASWCSSVVSAHFIWPYSIYVSLQVKRADAIRAFIMLKYGGMYLDLDNECYVPAEEAFGDYEVVLQGTGFEGVNNGMMASVAGHPIWKQ